MLYVESLFIFTYSYVRSSTSFLLSPFPRPLLFPFCSSSHLLSSRHSLSSCLPFPFLFSLLYLSFPSYYCNPSLISLPPLFLLSSFLLLFLLHSLSLPFTLLSPSSVSPIPSFYPSNSPPPSPSIPFLLSHFFPSSFLPYFYLLLSSPPCMCLSLFLSSSLLLPLCP